MRILPMILTLSACTPPAAVHQRVNETEKRNISLAVLSEDEVQPSTDSYGQHHATVAFRPTGEIRMVWDEGRGSARVRSRTSQDGVSARAITLHESQQSAPTRSDIHDCGDRWCMAWNSMQHVFLGEIDNDGQWIGTFERVTESPAGRGETRCPGPSTGGSPALAMAPDGSRMVVYQVVQPGADHEGEIYVRPYDEAMRPTGPEVRVGRSISQASPPDLAYVRAGVWRVVYTRRGADCLAGELVMQDLDARGQRRGPELLVDERSTEALGRPNIAVTPSGISAVVWRVHDGEGQALESYLRVVNPEGSDARALVLGNTADRPEVIAANNHFVITTEEPTGDGTKEIVVRAVTSKGAPAAPPVRLGDPLEENQRGALAIATRMEGQQVAVSWESQTDRGLELHLSTLTLSGTE